jgi:hypothetical protein
LVGVSDTEPRRAGGKPAIRAVQTRALVDLVAGLSTTQRNEVIARARPEVLERARRSFALAWFPMEEHMHVCGIVYDVVGGAEFRDLFRRTFAASMQTPMLRGIFGMIRRVADDPGATLLRNAPRIYDHMTRDVGELVAKVQDRGQGPIEMRGWPSSRWDFEVWLVGTLACIEGALIGVGLGATTQVTVELRDAPRGFGIYRVRW